MAGLFASASSQFLTNTGVSITYPVTIGAWVYPTTTGTLRSVFSICAVSTTHKFDINQTVADSWSALNVGPGGSSNAAAGTVTANSWFFLLARFVASNNRKLAVLQPDGSAAFGTSAVANAATGLIEANIGAAHTSALPSGGQFFSGLIGEVWYTNTDIQPDGAQLADSTLRQLAYGGPFSIPDIAANIREYRSLRTSLTADKDQGSEIYAGAGVGWQTWTNSGGAIIGAHPPLPSWYVTPRPSIMNLTV